MGCDVGVMVIVGSPPPVKSIQVFEAETLSLGFGMGSGVNTKARRLAGLADSSGF